MIEATIEKARQRLLKMHYEAYAGHLGGNLSCLDSMMLLHHVVMKEEDLFLLSKGHSAGALYVTLWSKGLLSDEDLDSFAKDGTMLPGHPSGKGIPGLLFSTGSLGHGPSLAAGLALASRYRGTNRQVYCMCSDGEWQEGSCWEALIFAVHNRLDNLTILIDLNGLQAFGTTENVASMTDLGAKIAAFGASVSTVDGHDLDAMYEAMRSLVSLKPSFVLLRTIKGKGAYFENSIESHYLPLTEEQYKAACSGEVCL
jgi:transketolase